MVRVVSVRLESDVVPLPGAESRSSYSRRTCAEATLMTSASILRSRHRVLRYRRLVNRRGGVEKYLAESSKALSVLGWGATIASAKVPDGPGAFSDTTIVETPQIMTPVGALSPRLTTQAIRTRPNVVEVHGLNSMSALAHLRGPWLRLVYPYFHPTILGSERESATRERVIAAYRWADALVLMTEDEREFLQELTNHSLADAIVVSPAADGRTVTSSPKRSEPRTLLLVISRLETEKRVDTVISAAAEAGLLDRLRVVGGGPDRPRLESLIDVLGGSSEQTLLGRISDDHLLSLLEGSRALVSMSKSESYGVTLQEALASGTSIIASDIPSHRWILQAVPSEFYQLIGGPDSPLLADAMTNPPCLPPAGVYNRQWSDVARELANAYETLPRRRRVLFGRLNK